MNKEKTDKKGQSEMWKVEIGNCEKQLRDRKRQGHEPGATGRDRKGSVQGRNESGTNLFEGVAMGNSSYDECVG